MRFVLPLVVTLLLHSQAFAQTSGDPFPGIGAEATASAIGKMFMAAPLPSLNGVNGVLTPQVGVVNVPAKTGDSGETNSSAPSNIYRYKGEAKGPSAGLALSVHLTENLSFFIFGIGTKIKGEFAKTENDVQTHKMTEIKGESIAGIVGFQYRLIGDSSSTFALGLYAGAMGYSSKSSGLYETSNMGAGTTDVEFNPAGYGPLAGLQLMFRFGDFRINPYVIAAGELGGSCKNIGLTGGPASASEFSCDGQTGKMKAPQSFAGAGLNVGFKRFMFNVGSIGSASTFDNFKTTSLALSYGIPL